MASVSGALRLGIAGGSSPADVDPTGVDTVYGFNGTDTLSTGAQRAAGGDRFLDDAGGYFDAPLSYALAFQYLLAEAWKGEPSVILRHLDQDGSCAPAADKEVADGAPRDGLIAPDAPATAEPPVADIDSVLHATAGDGGDAEFADASIAGGDFFGMS